MVDTGWEHERDWGTIRPFVYYQRENFVHQELVAGRDVVDFSAGLGDLSEYVGTLSPASLTATAHPDGAPRPDRIPPEARWVPGVGAQDIGSRLEAESADVILARMVIQFPTVERDTVDVDDILAQMTTILRPGGRVVVSTHAYFDIPGAQVLAGDLDAYLETVAADAQRMLSSDDPVTRRVGDEIFGRIALVHYLGLPPREGPFGTTGFGLKIPMLIQSFIRAGFTVESIEDLEPFTYPYQLGGRSGEDVVAMGADFMARKRDIFTSAAYRDRYQRPGVLRTLIADLRALTPVTSVPIVRVEATRH